MVRVKGLEKATFGDYEGIKISVDASKAYRAEVIPTGHGTVTVMLLADSYPHQPLKVEVE